MRRKKKINEDAIMSEVDIDVLDVLPEKPKKQKRGKKNVEHYVNAQELNQKIVDYYKEGKPDDISVSLATDISKIANRLAFAPNFINYSYREEMVGDAIVKMFSALRNKKFKIDNGYNPFSYFTKIAFNAFCNRIKKEKRNHAAIQAYQEEVYGSLVDHGHQPQSTLNPDEFS